MKKKYLTILCDGMADYPDSRGLTPMDEAHKPAMDELCGKGAIGLVKTVPDGMKAGSDVCNLAALGYDPRECYTGRSPLEALSMGIDLSETDATLRVNLVTLSEEPRLSDRTMLDYSAGEISSEEAAKLITALQPLFAEYGVELYAGVSYRHAAVIRGAGMSGTEFTPPHDITGKPVKNSLPKNGKSEFFTQITERSAAVLSEHPVNAERVRAGKNPANSVWFWGEGTKPALTAFFDKFGKTATVISAVDLVKGIGKAGGMTVVDIPTATGTVDTDYEAKTAAAKLSLRTYDYCFVHLEGPDECGHQGDRGGKITAIERIDARVLKPLLEHLKSSGAPFAVSVMPDHATPLSVRTHTKEPVPFLIYDSEDEKHNAATKFCEKSAARSGIYLANGYDVINALFGRKPLKSDI
ncbi:MAG: cofactor-independent phosphoglycerate mutase [Clostridiales bacterium]|nr:cofactor-independent phosphoglycerate mutase [Clostridiales bacterium]